MKYKILNNYLENPLLVLESFNPERKIILHKVKNKDAKILCKVNLWNNGSPSSLEEVFSKYEFKEFRKILNLKPHRWPEGYIKDELTYKKRFGSVNNINYKLTYKDKFGINYVSPNFAKCVCEKDNCEIVVCFTAGERSPMHYQCYVFAELIRELDDEE
jgi:hypothetical protein